MEFEHVYCNITNENSEQEIILDYDMTDLRLHPDYVYYYIHWFRFISTGIIPIIFLIIVNFAIYMLLPSALQQSHCRTVSFKCRDSQEDRERQPMTETQNPRKSIDSRSIQSSDSIISKLSASGSLRSSHRFPEDSGQGTSKSFGEPRRSLRRKQSECSRSINSNESIKLRTTASFKVRSQTQDSDIGIDHTYNQPKRRSISSIRSIKQSESMISRTSHPSMDMIPEDHTSLQNLRQQIKLKIKRRPASSYSTLTLLAIVIMYIVCNIPRLVLNLAEHLLQDQISTNLDICGCEMFPDWFIVLISINHFLLTVNSSANFIIYLSLEKKFKTTLRETAESLAEKTRSRMTSVEFSSSGQKSFEED